MSGGGGGMPSDPTKRSRVLRAHDLMDFVLSDEENGLWFGPRAAPVNSGKSTSCVRHESFVDTACRQE